jgi:hypothetical protein
MSISVNELNAMSDNEFVNSVNLATTDTERETLDQMFSVDGSITLTVNMVTGKQVKEKEITLHLDNYRKNVWKGTEFDDLRNSMRRVGQKERAVIMAIKGRTDEYLLDSGNHRLAAHIMNGDTVPFRVEVDTEKVTLDKIGIARAHLNQAMSNKRVKADTKSMLRTIVEAFKAGVPPTEIATKTGYSTAHIQSQLKISNESKEVLTVLGFDLRTNPFTPTQLTKLVPLARFVQAEIWENVKEEEGSKTAPAKFVSRLEALAEEEAIEEEKRQAVKDAIEAGESTDKKAVTVTSSEVNESTGEIETTQETVIVDKGETVVDCVSVKELYLTLIDMAVDHEPLTQVINQYFNVQ